MTDHTTADDASRYRQDEIVAAHWKEDPVARLRTYLNENTGWGRDEEEHLLETTTAEVEEAAQAYLNEPPQPPESMFDYLFATLPPELARQREEVLKRAGEGGNHD